MDWRSRSSAQVLLGLNVERRSCSESKLLDCTTAPLLLTVDLVFRASSRLGYFFSAWPPKALRMAESSLFWNSALPRESKRE